MAVVALDCEMVGDFNDRSILAKVSIVDKNGIVYNKCVKRSASSVKDYRTPYSGIKKGDLDSGDDFKTVQADVRAILTKAGTIVGHDLKQDFAALELDVKEFSSKIKDTLECLPIQYGDSRSLKDLAKTCLNKDIQKLEHNSVEDAQTCLALYSKFHP